MKVVSLFSTKNVLVSGSDLEEKFFSYINSTPSEFRMIIEETLFQNENFFAETCDIFNNFMTDIFEKKNLGIVTTDWVSLFKEKFYILFDVFLCFLEKNSDFIDNFVKTYKNVFFREILIRYFMSQENDVYFTYHHFQDLMEIVFMPYIFLLLQTNTPMNGSVLLNGFNITIFNKKFSEIEICKICEIIERVISKFEKNNFQFRPENNSLFEKNLNSFTRIFVSEFTFYFMQDFNQKNGGILQYLLVPFNNWNCSDEIKKEFVMSIKDKLHYVYAIKTSPFYKKENEKYYNELVSWIEKYEK